MTTDVAVLGYASLDASVASPRFAGLDATTTLRSRLSTNEPAIGGIAHLVRAAATLSADVAAVSWVGADEWGTRWTKALAAAGVSLDGVATAGLRSPSAALVYFDDGHSMCLFDEGDCLGTGLTEAQRRVIHDARWSLVAVGPAAHTWELLDRLRPDAHLAWAVKRDERNYSPPLVERLLARADVVSFSEHERQFLMPEQGSLDTRVRPGCLLVETHGSRGARHWFAGEGESTAREVPVEKVSATDTTGAGDTFVGSLVARLATHQPAALHSADFATQCVAGAQGDVARLLRSRT